LSATDFPPHSKQSADFRKWPYQPAGDPPWLIKARSFIGTTWNNGPMPATIKAWVQETAGQF
jgi:hypothetical protein